MPVGELFLSAFLQVLFDRLTSPELLQFATQEGIRSKLKKWEKTLKMIEALLIDAEEKQLTDGAVKLWLDDLQDLAYDLEDILDEFATEALDRKVTAENHASSSKVRSLIPSCFTGMTPSALKFNISMRSKIDRITSRLEDLCKQKIELGLEKIAGGTSTAVWRRPESTSVPTEPAVYGRDEDKTKILEMVLRDEPSDANFHVIPIVGLGGVGKTTVAREVYNDKAVECFKPRAWACVSDDYDVLRISKAILESITSSSCSLTSLNEVQVQLKNAVGGKKFLLVLDDVWSKDYGLWEALKSPFMAGALGSKMIVTTRSVDVALTMGREFYRLDLLTDDACWAIFEKHASGSRVISTVNQNLESIREKVVNKCKGLALAARTLGGLLRSKQRDDEWEDILNNKIWDLSDESDILPVLKLSYHHLPSHLKRCFVYCAIFPKDYEFEEEELVLLWMAEGLIQQLEKKKQLEDLGGDYFRDLVSRSIFQQSSNNGSKFVIHDLVNDLAQRISREISFRLEDESSVTQIKRFERIRHSSYTFREYEVKNNFEVFNKVEQLRIFLRILLPWRSQRDTYITKIVFLDLLPKLKNLRSLSLTNYYFMELPDSIGCLRHLRYLNLTGTGIPNLPESTSSLFNLQSFILRDCFRLAKLPSHMRNLINLRHLDIGGINFITEMPSGMRKLKCLMTLSNFIVGNSIGSSLKDLKDLKFLRGELCISGLENATDCQDTVENLLCDKKDLEVLVLKWTFFNPSEDGEVEKIILDNLRPPKNLKELTINNYGGKNFSSWITDSSFSKMAVLKLVGCRNCTTLPPLGLLGPLKNLTIKTMGRIKKIGFEIYGDGCSKSFQSLETLCFENLQEWELWDPMEENDHIQRFPCLQQLNISECPNLIGRLPNHLPLLGTLVINNCEQLVVSLSNLPVLHSLEINRCEQLVVSFLNLPMLRSLKINICKGKIYSSLTDCKTQHSMTSRGSNFSVLRNCSREGFQNLESLYINGCEELIHLWSFENCLDKPPQGLHNFTSLKDLCISNLPNLVSFPDGFLSVFSHVDISYCDALTSLQGGLKHNNARLKYLSILRCNSLAFIVRGRLPSSLQRLYVLDCENMVCLLDGEDSFTSSPSSSSLMHKENVDNTSTSLLKIEIRNCPSLTHLWSTDQLPSTLSELVIHNCSNLRTLLSSGQLLKALVCLRIGKCPKLESVVESFSNITSLESVSFADCENLKSIPEGLHTLGSLSFIGVCNCPNLVLFTKDGLPNTDLVVVIDHFEKLQALPSHMHSLRSLRHLTLNQCPSITSFPEDFPTNLASLEVNDPNIIKSLIGWGLHKLTSLRKLKIGGLLDAVSFPKEDMPMMFPISLIKLRIEGFLKLKYLSSKGFQNLTSLESLKIWDCPNLTLTDLPSSLLNLEIYYCPLLKKQCRRNEGEVLSKIAHIPCVRIDGKLIYDLNDSEEEMEEEESEEEE